MKVFTVPDGVIIKSWCDSPEDGAIQQAKHFVRDWNVR